MAGEGPFLGSVARADVFCAGDVARYSRSLLRAPRETMTQIGISARRVYQEVSCEARSREVIDDPQ